MPDNTKLDETLPGGVYLIDGVKVNANGEPIKDTAKDSKPADSTQPKA